jgi:VCBS repeat-containing protein
VTQPTAYTDTAADDTFGDITGTLSGSDRDNDTFSFALSDSEVTPDGAEKTAGFDVQKTWTYGTFYLNTTSGAYKFVANEAKAEGLKTGTVTEDFVVSASAGGDSTPSQTITVTINGANDRPTFEVVSTTETSITLRAADRDDTDTILTLTQPVSGEEVLSDGQARTITVQVQSTNVIDIPLTVSDGLLESVLEQTLVLGTNGANVGITKIDASTFTNAAIIYGFGGNDEIVGTAFNDIIYGGDGKDVIRGGLGADTIYGGVGDDKIVVLGAITEEDVLEYTTLGEEAVNAALASAGLSGTISYAELITERPVSEIVAGENIVGGDGDDTLYVFGTADLSGVTIDSSVSNLGLFSTVYLTETQLSQLQSIILFGNTQHTIVITNDQGVQLANQRATFEQWLSRTGQQLFFENDGQGGRENLKLAIGTPNSQATEAEDGFVWNAQGISNWLNNGGTPFANELQAELDNSGGDNSLPAPLNPEDAEGDNPVLFVTFREQPAFLNQAATGGYIDPIAGGHRKFDGTNGTSDITNRDDAFSRLDISGAFSSGFTFGDSFYSAAQDFYVGTNGYVTFGQGDWSYSTGPSFENLSIAGNSPFIAPMMTDLHPGIGNGDVYYDVDPSSKTVVISWSFIQPYPWDVVGTDLNQDGVLTNDLQMTMTDLGDGQWFFTIRYGLIEYGSSNNGGDPSLGGYKLPGVGYEQLPFLTNEDWLDAQNRSNLQGDDTDGVFAFFVNSGVPMDAAIPLTTPGTAFYEVVAEDASPVTLSLLGDNAEFFDLSKNTDGSYSVLVGESFATGYDYQNDVNDIAEVTLRAADVWGNETQQTLKFFAPDSLFVA